MTSTPSPKKRLRLTPEAEWKHRAVFALSNPLEDSNIFQGPFDACTWKALIWRRLFSFAAAPSVIICSLWFDTFLLIAALNARCLQGCYNIVASSAKFFRAFADECSDSRHILLLKPLRQILQPKLLQQWVQICSAAESFRSPIFVRKLSSTNSMHECAKVAKVQTRILRSRVETSDAFHRVDVAVFNWETHWKRNFEIAGISVGSKVDREGMRVAEFVFGLRLRDWRTMLNEDGAKFCRIGSRVRPSLWDALNQDGLRAAPLPGGFAQLRLTIHRAVLAPSENLKPFMLLPPLDGTRSVTYTFARVSYDSIHCARTFPSKSSCDGFTAWDTSFLIEVFDPFAVVSVDVMDLGIVTGSVEVLGSAQIFLSCIRPRHPISGWLLLHSLDGSPAGFLSISAHLWDPRGDRPAVTELKAMLVRPSKAESLVLRRVDQESRRCAGGDGMEGDCDSEFNEDFRLKEEGELPAQEDDDDIVEPPLYTLLSTKGGLPKVEKLQSQFLRLMTEEGSAAAALFRRTKTGLPMEEPQMPSPAIDFQRRVRRYEAIGTKKDAAVPVEFEALVEKNLTFGRDVLISAYVYLETVIWGCVCRPLFSFGADIFYWQRPVMSALALAAFWQTWINPYAAPGWIIIYISMLPFGNVAANIFAEVETVDRSDAGSQWTLELPTLTASTPCGSTTETATFTGSSEGSSSGVSRLTPLPSLLTLAVSPVSRSTRAIRDLGVTMISSSVKLAALYAPRTHVQWTMNEMSWVKQEVAARRRALMEPTNANGSVPEWRGLISSVARTLVRRFHEFRELVEAKHALFRSLLFAIFALHVGVIQVVLANVFLPTDENGDVIPSLIFATQAVKWVAPLVVRVSAFSCLAAGTLVFAWKCPAVMLIGRFANAGWEAHLKERRREVHGWRLLTDTEVVSLGVRIDTM